jgi:ubiquinone/menaquinone biosynthesis C-methylase UbiE
MIFDNKLRAIKSIITGGNRNISRAPREAYKIWAECYDDEQDNLILFYDEIILKKLLEMTHLSGKTILDFGSGTGRNWNELLKHHPARIIGCDISPEMISRLKSKFPDAETYLIRNEKLDFLKEKECDIIISTLVISHVKDISKLFHEWNRVMNDSAHIIITDFHPDLFMKGGARTFKHAGTTYKIENYVHEVLRIEKMLSSIGFWRMSLIEKIIDEDVKPFYVKKNALHIYEKFKGTPFIYGLYLSRIYGDKKY